jgi:hypothetical protein
MEQLVAASLAARVGLPSYPDEGDGGLPDYSGPFDPAFVLEGLSGAAQRVVLDELATQSHLLLRSLLLAVTERYGEELADRMVPRLVRGWCGLTSQRLVEAFQLPATADGVASLLALHPVLAPVTYTEARVELLDDQHVSVSLGPGDGDHATWLSREDRGEVLEAFVKAAVPQARVHADGDALLVVVDPAAEPAPPPREVAIARISSGATFRFGRRPLPGGLTRTSV